MRALPLIPGLTGSIAALLAALPLTGQCVNVSTAATSYGAGDDFVANGGIGIDIGFAFPVGDGAGGTISYPFVHPSSNGFVYLSDGTTTITDSDASPSEAEMYDGHPRVAVCWDDMNLIASYGAGLFVDTSVPDRCTITWWNVVPFGETITYSMQCVLHSSGEIDLNYTPDAFNDSPAIVGVSPGNMAAGTQPISVDLLDASLSGASTGNDMTHERFDILTLDLSGKGIKMIPTRPGYLIAALTNACASRLLFGTGCPIAPTSAQEAFAVGTIDICQTGSTITFTRGPTEYTITDQIPRTFVPAQGNEIVWSTMDDGYAEIPLSAPMPTLAGTSTTTLTACTNGFITLTDQEPFFSGNSYEPAAAQFDEFDHPTIFGPWYDWNPSPVGGNGRVIYEEIAGIMYVTWEAVTPYNSSAANTFQFQFEIATGNCAIVYDSTNFAGNAPWHTALFGIAQGNTASSQEDWSTSLPTGVAIATQLPLTVDGPPPILGAGWNLTTTNIDQDSPVAVTYFGTPNAPGASLAAIGAPDCVGWLATLVGNLTAANSNGSCAVNLPIPNDPTFTGVALTAQSLCLTLTNPANLLTSNGTLGTVGF